MTGEQAEELLKLVGDAMAAHADIEPSR